MVFEIKAETEQWLNVRSEDTINNECNNDYGIKAKVPEWLRNGYFPLKMEQNY